MPDHRHHPGPVPVPQAVLATTAPSDVAFDDASLMQFIEALPCPALLESDNRIVAANTLARDLSGLPESGPVATEQLFLGAYPFARSTRKSDTALQDFRCILLCRSGKPLAIHGSLRVIETPSGPRRVVLVLNRNAGTETNGEEAFLGELLDAAPEGMAITHNGHLVHVNREFTRLFGYPPNACIGREIDSLLMPADRMHETEQLYHLLAADGRAALDTVRLTASGTPVDVSVLAGPVRLGGGAFGLFYTFRDIRPQKEAVAKLQHNAQHDHLTTLGNRALFLDRLEVARTRLRRRPSRTFAIFFVDLDGFKYINDTFGHSAGDGLLKVIAQRLQTSLRPQDTIARYGGDEFAMLLDEPESAERCEIIAARVLKAVSEPIYDDRGEMKVTASIGIVYIDNHEMPIETILNHADIAMYEAKRAGKSCARVYSDGMTLLQKAS